MSNKDKFEFIDIKKAMIGFINNELNDENTYIIDLDDPEYLVSLSELSLNNKYNNYLVIKKIKTN